jgi:hypothetical protein
MLEAGVKWLTSRATIAAPDLKASGLQGVTGLFTPESDDARELEKVILDASKGEATGAMHHTVMSRLFFISGQGWEKYCEELRERKAKGE